MKTPASVLGHPIHPMLIPFPYALWVFSLISDAIYYFIDRSPVWETVAYYTLAGGVIGAVLAALPGIVDYFSIKDRKVSKVAAWHARINVLALLIFATSFYFRTASGSLMVNRRFSVPALLSVLGVLLISVSGWLGGELVYKHHVGVETQPDRDLRAEAREPRRVA